MDFENWKVVDLRNKLKELGLPTSGLKQQLIERLQAAFEDEANEEAEPDSLSFQVTKTNSASTPRRDSRSSQSEDLQSSPRLDIEEVPIEEKLLQSQRESERLKFQLEQALEALNSAREQIALKEESVEKCLKDKESYAKQLEQWKKQGEHMKFTLETKEEQISQLKSKTQSLEKKMVTVESQFKGELNQRDMLQFELTKEKENGALKQENLKKMEIAMKQLRNELDALKQQYNDKQKECKQLQSLQESEKEKLLKEWRKEVESRLEQKYSSKMDKLTEQIEDLSNQITERDSRIEELESEKEKKDEEMDMQKSAIKKEREEFTRKSKEVESILVEFEKQKDDIVREEVEIERAKMREQFINELQARESQEKKLRMDLEVKLKEVLIKYDTLKKAFSEYKVSSENNLKQVSKENEKLKSEVDKAIFSNLSSSFISLNESSLKDESLPENSASDFPFFSFKDNQENLNTTNALFTQSLIEERPKVKQPAPRPPSANSNKHLGISAIGKSSTSKVRMSLLPQSNIPTKSNTKLPVRRGSSLLPKEIKDGLQQKT